MIVQRDWEEEASSIYWPTLQITLIARIEWVPWSKTGSWEHLLGLPHGCRDPRTWANLHCFLRWELEQLEHKLEPIRGTDATGGWSACCSTTLAQFKHFWSPCSFLIIHILNWSFKTSYVCALLWKWNNHTSKSNHRISPPSVLAAMNTYRPGVLMLSGYS